MKIRHIWAVMRKEFDHILRDRSTLFLVLFTPTLVLLLMAYALTVELSGFSKFERKNVLLQSRGDVTVDMNLELGSRAEVVTVTETPVAVQFNTSTHDLTIETAMEWIDADELVEVTPDAIRVRKQILQINLRPRRSEAIEDAQSL